MSVPSSGVRGNNNLYGDQVFQFFAVFTGQPVKVALTRAGIGIDFGHDADLVPGELAGRVHDRYPRLDMARCLTDAITGQAQGRPQKAPPYTLPGELVRERAVGSSGTGMERLAAQGRWGS